MQLPATLSHAYIIAGGSEQSRLAFAGRMAAAYLCEGEHPPCGSCRHCRKAAAGIHPDISRVTLLPDKREISVDQARALRTDVYIRPNEGKRKVYIIDPADRMRPEGQNAMLKVLEEGPAYGAFLLLAEQPGRLLETIRSRCEQLTLPPEEPHLDEELLRQGEELARKLLSAGELELAEYFVELEERKLKSGEMLTLLSAAEREVSRRLTAEPRRAVQVLTAMKTVRDTAVYNPATGHTLGWLASELFR